MTKDMTKAKTWVKPKVERLGELKDVAASTGSGTQGGMS